MKNKYPPYGKQLMAIINAPKTWRECYGTSPDGKHLTIWIAIGSQAWEWAKARVGHKLVVVVPDDESPDIYRYSFVKGHDPILVQQCGETSADFIKSLVAALMRDGAQRVWVWGRDESTLYKGIG
jgi:hypothetical protein